MIVVTFCGDSCTRVYGCGTIWDNGRVTVVCELCSIWKYSCLTECDFVLIGRFFCIVGYEGVGTYSVDVFFLSYESSCCFYFLDDIVSGIDVLDSFCWCFLLDSSSEDIVLVFSYDGTTLCYLDETIIGIVDEVSCSITF